MTILHSRIAGTGSFLPQRVVPNSELELSLGTSDAWIREKIGITQRHYVDPGVGTSDLGVEAARNALRAAGRNPADVDCLIAATSTPDYAVPGIGVLIQDKLGCRHIPAFDVHNASPGFIFSLELADSLIRSGKYRCILLVAADVHSTALDFSPRGRLMSVIFGDGAGAVVLEPTQGTSAVIGTKLHSDGKYFDKLWCQAPSSLNHPRLTQEMLDEGMVFPTMDGRVVFENAVQLMSEVSQEILSENGLTLADVAFAVPHQANLRIIEAIAQKLGLPMSKVLHNIARCANTNSATVPIMLDEAVRDGRIKSGDLLLAMSFGSGFSWGSALLRY